MKLALASATRKIPRGPTCTTVRTTKVHVVYLSRDINLSLSLTRDRAHDLTDAISPNPHIYERHASYTTSSYRNSSFPIRSRFLGSLASRRINVPSINTSRSEEHKKKKRKKKKKKKRVLLQVGTHARARARR